jgi:CheY-like chemotaxis protein
MGGSIEVQSSENEGSDFRFSILLEVSDVPDFVSSAKNRRNISLFNATSNKQLHAQVDHYAGIAGVHCVSSTDEPDYIMTDEPQHSIENKKLILISPFKIKGNSINYWGQLTSPLRLSSFLKILDIHPASNTYRDESRVPEEEQVSLSQLLPLNILVAEDNKTNQKLMIKTLKYLGYVPTIAGNGLEALDSLSRKNFDLIFMDIQMPEMDGLEATRSIKRIYQAKRPFIIAMTASALQEEKELCFLAGVDDYLSKPAKMEHIEEMINKWGKALSQKRLE